jgi:hypothetical protein
MECPRCGEELTTFTLDGNRSVVCEACEYVGVPADHHVDRGEGESWDEALERFHGEKSGDGEGEAESANGGGLPTESANGERPPTESESPAG